MKDDNKICFNKTLTYLILLVLAVVGAFYIMNYANTQKLGSESKAGARCSIVGGGTLNRDKFDCSGITGGTAGRFYYYNKIDKNYYKDTNCQQLIEEGVGNYCKGLSGNKTTCVRAYCPSPNISKPLYIKDSRYYTNGSCLGMLGTNVGGAFTPLTASNYDAEYCKKSTTSLIPLKYDCPAPSADKVFYYQNGNYYKDIAKTVKVTDFGVGNFCKVVGGQTGAPTKSLIPTSCKELGISTTLNGTENPNKSISVYAEDLYSDKTVIQFSGYFLGTSQASAYTTVYTTVQTYCQAPSGSSYISGNCLSRLCAGDVAKKFFMKNGTIYTNNTCSTATTYSEACK